MPICWQRGFSTALLVLALSLLLFSTVRTSSRLNTGQGRAGIQRGQLYLHSKRVAPFPEPQTLGSLSGGIVQSKRVALSPQEQKLKHADILKCIEWHESRGNPKAYNPLDTDGKSKFGVLQFGWPTFAEQCVRKRGYPNKIWDPEIQRKCANDLIKDNQGWRWPTIKHCR